MNTSQKITIARIIFSFLQLVGVKHKQIVTRNGITYELDLREGIDLSIFLFGAFESHIARNASEYIPENGVFLDVGANVGAISLLVAKLVKHGRVYAIEPTDYAYAKLRRNITLNFELAERIFPVQTFFAEQSNPQSNLVAYSSWAIKENKNNEVHPVHKGSAMVASCGQVTVDDFVLSQQLETVSLIKIDTDGHEYHVLLGAQNTLKKYKPVIIFEACQYLMLPPNPTFSDLKQLLSTHSYRLCRLDRHTEITVEVFERECPPNGGMNLLAIPNENT